MFQFANDSDVELCTDIQDVVRTIVQTLSRSGPAMPDEMIYLDYQERRGWRGPKRITKNLLSQLNRGGHSLCTALSLFNVPSKTFPLGTMKMTKIYTKSIVTRS